MLTCAGGRTARGSAGFIGEKTRLGTFALGAINGFFFGGGRCELSTSCHRGPRGSGLQFNASNEAERNATEQLQPRGAHYSAERGDRGGDLAPQVCLGHCGAWAGFFFTTRVCAQHKAEAEAGGQRGR